MVGFESWFEKDYETPNLNSGFSDWFPGDIPQKPSSPFMSQLLQGLEAQTIGDATGKSIAGATAKTALDLGIGIAGWALGSGAGYLGEGAEFLKAPIESLKGNRTEALEAAFTDPADYTAEQISRLSRILPESEMSKSAVGHVVSVIDPFITTFKKMANLEEGVWFGKHTGGPIKETHPALYKPLGVAVEVMAFAKAHGVGRAFKKSISAKIAKMEEIRAKRTWTAEDEATVRRNLDEINEFFAKDSTLEQKLLEHNPELGFKLGKVTEELNARPIRMGGPEGSIKALEAPKGKSKAETLSAEDRMFNALQKLEPKVAKPESESITLYRAESPTVKFNDIFDREKLTRFKTDLEGDFWTESKEYADYFRESYGKDAIIREIKLPKKDIDKYQTAAGDYVIPRNKSTLIEKFNKGEKVSADFPDHHISEKVDIIRENGPEKYSVVILENKFGVRIGRRDGQDVFRVRGPGLDEKGVTVIESELSEYGFKRPWIGKYKPEVREDIVVKDRLGETHYENMLPETSEAFKLSRPERLKLRVVERKPEKIKSFDANEGTVEIVKAGDKEYIVTLKDKSSEEVNLDSTKTYKTKRGATNYAKKLAEQKKELGTDTPEMAMKKVEEILPDVERFLKKGEGDPAKLRDRLSTAVSKLPVSEGRSAVIETGEVAPIGGVSGPGAEIVTGVERLMGEINRRVKNAEQIRRTERQVEGKGVERSGIEEEGRRSVETRGEKIPEEVTPFNVADRMQVLKERQKALNERVREQNRLEKEIREEVDRETTTIKQEELDDLIREQKEDLGAEERFAREYNRTMDDDSNIGDYGIDDMAGDLYDLFIKGEKGSFSRGKMTPEEIAKLHKIWQKARDMGRNLGDYIKAAIPEVTDETVRRLEEFAENHFVQRRPYEPSGREGILKEGAKRKVGKWIVKDLDYPREWFDNWMKMNPVTFLKSVGGRYGTTARAFFNQAPWLRDLLYYPWRRAVKVSQNRKRQLRDNILKPLKAMVNKESRRNIRDHAIVQQLYKRDANGEIIIENGKPIFEEHAKEFMEKNKIKAIPRLNKTEAYVYNELRRLYDALYLEINQMRVANGLNPFKKVPDYFTYMRAVSALERVGLGKEMFFKRPQDLLSDYAKMKELPFQWRHARVKHRTHRLHNELFDIFENYADLAFDHIEVSPIVAKARAVTKAIERPAQKITKSGGVGKETFDPLKDADFMNREAARYVNQWAHKISGVPLRYDAPPRIRRILNKLNSNLAAGIIGANMRTVFVQPLALVGAYAELGGTYLLKGIYDMPSPTKYRKARLKSDVLSTRTPEATFADNLGRIGELRISEFPRVARNISFKGLEIFDNLTAHTTWNGAYAKARDGKVPGRRQMSEFNAARYADDVVIKTQGSGLPGEVSPLQYTSWGKSAFMFQTFVINNWNFLAYEALGLHPSVKIKQALPKIARYMFAAAAANFVFEDLAGMKSPMGRPIKAFTNGIEDNNNAFDIAMDVTGELLEPVTGFGGVRYGSHILGPVVQRLGDVTTGGKFGMTPKKEISEWLDTGRVPDKTLQLAGELRGVPGTGQAVGSYRAWKRGESPWGIAIKRYTEPDQGTQLSRKRY